MSCDQHIPSRQYLIPGTALLKYKKDAVIWNALQCVAPVLNSDIPNARQRDSLRCLYVIGGLGQFVRFSYVLIRLDVS